MDDIESKTDDLTKATVELTNQAAITEHTANVIEKESEKLNETAQTSETSRAEEKAQENDNSSEG